jgi:glycosyltransferase involved in cell wall biosynthesis
MEQDLGQIGCDDQGNPTPRTRVSSGSAPAESGNGGAAPLPGVSVVIPAYNERDAIAAVVDHVHAVLAGAGVAHEVIVVDDGSSDGTYELARAARARVLRHPSNRGYGAALKTGIRGARYDLMCIIDADCTYPVEELPRMIAVGADADMVVGARTGNEVHIPLLRRPAKYLLSVLANFLTGTKIPDLNSGMRVIRRALVLEYIDILPDRFSFTTTITLAGLCDGYRVEFVPIGYRRRTGRSKLRPHDFLNFIILICRTMAYFRPLRMLVPVALVLFAGGFAKLLWDIYCINVKGTSIILLLASLHVLTLAIVADLICFLRRRRAPVLEPPRTPRGAANGQAEMPHDDLTFSRVPETTREARAKEEAAERHV